MNEYSVTVLVDASRNYTVKAESPEAAVEQAEELYSRESSTLCHQCSSTLDVGGAVGAIVYCEDKEVLDTGYQASRIAALEAECEQLRKEKSARQALSIQLIDEARALRAELAAIKGQWIPVSERLPADSRDVLVYCSDTDEHVVGSSMGCGRFAFAFSEHGTRICCKPSHWRYIDEGDRPAALAAPAHGKRED